MKKINYYDDHTKIAINKYIEQGKKYFQLRDYEKALEELQIVTKIDPRCIDAIDFIAHIYYCNENYEEALKYYIILIQLVPGKIDVLKRLVKLYERLGKCEKKMLQLIECYTIEPNDRWVKKKWRELLNSLFLKGNPGFAIECYKNVKELYPHNIYLHRDILTKLLQNNKFLHYFTKSYKSINNKNFFETIINGLKDLANVFYKKEEFETASIYFKALNKIYPDNEVIIKKIVDVEEKIKKAIITNSQKSVDKFRCEKLYQRGLYKGIFWKRIKEQNQWQYSKGISYWDR